MLDSLEQMKISVERALPPNVVAALREADVALTLVPQQAPHRALVDISDELAERELLGDMVSLRKEETGVDNTIWVSGRAHARHAARIKVAIDPPHTFDPTTVTASVMINNCEVVAGEVPAKLHKQVKEWIELNRPALLDYWNYLISTKMLEERLKSIESNKPVG